MKINFIAIKICKDKEQDKQKRSNQLIKFHNLRTKYIAIVVLIINWITTYLQSRMIKYASYSIVTNIPVLIISKEISTPFSCLRSKRVLPLDEVEQEVPENRFAQQFPVCK